MDYKKSFFTLLGAILLYGFYSFVESKKSSSTSISQTIEPQKPAPVAEVVAPTEVKQAAIVVAPKKESDEVSHRKNLAAFEKEFSKTYYSDGKIVEYRKKLRRQAQIDERNLESEFSKIDDN